MRASDKLVFLLGFIVFLDRNNWIKESSLLELQENIELCLLILFFAELIIIGIKVVLKTAKWIFYWRCSRKAKAISENARYL